ncbi:YegP family protein [Pseudarthrobacter phenanthrenivorans]|jgi:hypothetical protein|uniref:YegP family protein n=1 Tax=Micrococcaceae TaxID=1268 RepID=UPI00240EF61F|nr:YegP family protein [Arthrobacter sp. NQ7]MDJ0456674.1 YegP family protein [Arthrobacter sp. NQ7]
MAGTFELFVDEESRIRFRMVMPDGHVLAVSGQFTDKRAAAAAIEEVRECAGTGLIRDVVLPAPEIVRACPHQARHAARRGVRALGSLGAA